MEKSQTGATSVNIFILKPKCLGHTLKCKVVKASPPSLSTGNKRTFQGAETLPLCIQNIPWWFQPTAAVHNRSVGGPFRRRRWHPPDDSGWSKLADICCNSILETSHWQCLTQFDQFEHLLNYIDRKIFENVLIIKIVLNYFCNVRNCILLEWFWRQYSKKRGGGEHHLDVLRLFSEVKSDF